MIALMYRNLARKLRIYRMSCMVRKEFGVIISLPLIEHERPLAVDIGE